MQKFSTVQASAQQDVKFSIKHTPVFSTMTLLMTAFLLTACQSAPQQSKSKSQATKTTNTGLTRLEISRRAVPIIKSKDGVQDIPWTITQVKYKKALYFNQMPKILLQSNSQRLVGSTGCNGLFGTYQINVPNRTLSIDASAEYETCNNALAQEADLMDALKRVEKFEITAQGIRFYDANRQIVIQAEQR